VQTVSNQQQQPLFISTNQNTERNRNETCKGIFSQIE